MNPLLVKIAGVEWLEHQSVSDVAYPEFLAMERGCKRGQIRPTVEVPLYTATKIRFHRACALCGARGGGEKIRQTTEQL